MPSRDIDEVRAQDDGQRQPGRERAGHGEPRPAAPGATARLLCTPRSDLPSPGRSETTSSTRSSPGRARPRSRRSWRWRTPRVAALLRSVEMSGAAYAAADSPHCERSRSGPPGRAAAQPPDADVDDVRSGIEVVSPRLRESRSRLTTSPTWASRNWSSRNSRSAGGPRCRRRAPDGAPGRARGCQPGSPCCSRPGARVQCTRAGEQFVERERLVT